MIICITGMFDVYGDDGVKTGKSEFVVSHGVDYYTGKTVILPNEHPVAIGAVYSREIGEWVVE